MQFESAAQRSFAIVSRALRQAFPDDYFKRCMYAALGQKALLSAMGHEAKLQCGDMLAFLLSASGQQVSMQGFANSDTGHAHYWLIADNRLLDIGPHYLPVEAGFQAVRMPLIAWDMSDSFPVYLRYRAVDDLGSQVWIVDREIRDRVERFVALCMSKLEKQVGQPTAPHWMLSGHDELQRRAQKGDVWARAALIAAENPQRLAGLPF